jgi:hypothetical protein
MTSRSSGGLHPQKPFTALKRAISTRVNRSAFQARANIATKTNPTIVPTVAGKWVRLEEGVKSPPSKLLGAENSLDMFVSHRIRRKHAGRHDANIRLWREFGFGSAVERQQNGKPGSFLGLIAQGRRVRLA